MPARCFLKCVKGHAGYFDCDKCEQEGSWHSKMTFPETTAPLRTDMRFHEMTNAKHHSSLSLLTTLWIGMVSQFGLDYMHLVCLGVMKRLLLCWMKGPLKTRMPARIITHMSVKLLGLVPFIPREFAQKSRSLNEIKNWKATEF